MKTLVTQPESGGQGGGREESLRYRRSSSLAAGGRQAAAGEYVGRQIIQFEIRTLSYQGNDAAAIALAFNVLHSRGPLGNYRRRDVPGGGRRGVFIRVRR